MAIVCRHSTSCQLLLTRRGSVTRRSPSWCLEKNGLCRGVRDPVYEAPIPFDHPRVQLVCGANTNNIGVMFLSGCLKLGEAAMKPTDEEKVASLKRETLPTFVLAALIFMLIVAGTSALWWFMIAPMRRWVSEEDGASLGGATKYARQLMCALNKRIIQSGFELTLSEHSHP